MHIGIVINARCGSLRWPHKHFADINGQPALSHLLRRLPKGRNIWIATGTRKENKAFESFKIPVFYGDPLNVPARHYQLAAHHQLDAIVSIDGDDLFFSVEALNKTLDLLEKNFDLVSTRGLPEGMNILWAYKISKLKEAIDKNITKMNDTGWGWIFNNMEAIYYHFDDRFHNLRLTLDTQEDLNYFRFIIKNCPLEIQLCTTKLCQWIIANASKK